MDDLKISKPNPSDHEAIWEIIKVVIATGDTYVFNPESSKEDMLSYWCGKNKHCHVAKLGQKVVATFIIKDNQPGLGSHIANASYMVHPDFRGRGIGHKICKASLDIARDLGYEAMQFNIVVKSNTAGVNLWQKLGFSIVGEIPNAFKHVQLGLVNAYVMYRSL
ncbi:GNAT family N-acetyltransferase [Fulvivirga sp. RKSG066]|uniref:GNAT family N-acetyltransferase n=1 Tax=Fulvivirga aurantia TaxID=2529383 RepID=UPI0012BCC3FB|nr:GNAT family N-acetyltransferase [Fulvivirga aurantia]MTI20935.1 GNAT family N-acetyltransferase [Fulvivirga aurantia]